MKFIYTLILMSLMTGFSLYNRVAATSVVGLLCNNLKLQFALLMAYSSLSDRS
jgi:hypothetical protein